MKQPELISSNFIIYAGWPKTIRDRIAMSERVGNGKDGIRVAVLSCIHGNMEALETVMDDVKNQNVDLVVCLGDLVGYGPYPNEVVNYVEHNNIKTIMGCWDEGIAMNNTDCGCNFVSDEDALYGHLAFSWTKSRLEKKHQDFLKELHNTATIKGTKAGNLLFVHGSPRSATEYLTESTHDLILLERAAAGECDVLICGHTHIPFARKINGTLNVRAEAGIKNEIHTEIYGKESAPQVLELSPKLIINAGSVGEPRHGSPASTYVIFNDKTQEVEIREVPYDVQKTVKALQGVGLPDVFAERLLVGKEIAAKDKAIVCEC